MALAFCLGLVAYKADGPAHLLVVGDRPVCDPIYDKIQQHWRQSAHRHLAAYLHQYNLPVPAGIFTCLDLVAAAGVSDDDMDVAITTDLFTSPGVEPNERPLIKLFMTINSLILRISRGRIGSKLGTQTHEWRLTWSSFWLA